jgi:hypothetical protein
MQRRATIATVISAALVAGGVALAVPVIAGANPSPSASSAASPAPTALTADEQATLNDFLATHPEMARNLADRLDRWKAFADANPELVAELKKVAGLPKDQRKAELAKWLSDHPDQKAALEKFRDEGRDIRKDARQDRRDRRGQHTKPSPSGSATPSDSPTPSPTS